MWNNYLKKIKSYTSAFLCVCILAGAVAIAPINHKLEVQEVEAQFVVTDPTNTAVNQQNAILSSMQAALQDYFYIKEFSLDGIASGLAKLVLKSITQSILTWINSGFQGSPAFVTDLEQFLLDRADQVAGDFIYNNEDLNFLCSPFQLDVKIALATSYQEGRDGGFDSQCTLSNVTDNVEGFLSGSFSDGGWASWFEVTQNPINTPTGAYLAAEGNLRARIVDAEGNTVRDLDWSRGFLSFKVCSDAQKASGNVQDCDITTPGAVIEQALTVNLENGTQALIEADEINEIIGALFAQLAKQAITGINGLLGLGGGSQYSSNSFGVGEDSSFLDALAEENTVSEGVENPFVNAILMADEHIVLQNEIITIVNDVQGSLINATNQYGSCIGIDMPTELEELRTLATTQILSASSSIQTLLLLNDRYLNPLDTQEQIETITTYQHMLTTGLIINEANITELEFFIQYELTPDINDFKKEIRSAVTRCDDDD